MAKHGSVGADDVGQAFVFLNPDRLFTGPSQQIGSYFTRMGQNDKLETGNLTQPRHQKVR